MSSLQCLFHFCLIYTVVQGFIFDKPTSTIKDSIVQTSCGPVKGKFNGNAYAYKGIPYSVPPVGKRRWQLPEGLSKTKGTCWPGTFDASTLKSQCVQRSVRPEPDGNHQIVGTEDCLYLNVWSPTNLTSANLSVMVFIHGGSLQIGNSDQRAYAPTEQLARDTNIVYVSMNYRLQAFGFMALELLSLHSKTNTSGNYGFMDQILALKWVQENIRNFGGDPGKVTLFGHSSGGTSVMALVTSPLAKGLFRNAWILSGSPLLTITATEAFQQNLKFLNNTGCTNVTCLLDMSAEDVTRAVPWNTFPSWAMEDQVDLPERGKFDGGMAIVDGFVLPQAPFDSWINGLAIDVPLMIGTTAQETDFDEVPDAIRNSSSYLYKKYVASKLDTFGTDITKMALRMYPVDKESTKYQFTSMVSDVRVGCPTDVMALYAAVNTHAPVYRYVVTSQPSSPVISSPVSVFASTPQEHYSFHAWDAYAFFGTINQVSDQPSSNDIMFEANIQREILSFVENGHPYSSEWSPFPESTVLLSDVSTVTSSYHPHQCEFWMQNGFFDYAWIN